MTEPAPAVRSEVALNDDDTVIGCAVHGFQGQGGTVDLYVGDKLVGGAYFWGCVWCGEVNFE